MVTELDRKVSIVMCTYNGAAFLKEQLETIVNQTYPIHEIIIQDDDSTDGTWDILQTYAQQYPSIKLFHNEIRKGVNHNFLSAIRLAARRGGQFIAISDQDDIWELNKIERQIKEIGNASLCYHYSKHFSEDGVPIDFNPRMPNYTLMRMIYFNEIPGHTMLIRKELLDYIVDERCFLYDALLAIAAGVQNKIVFIPEILVHQRRYSNAISYRPPISTERNIKTMTLYIIEATKNLIHNKQSMKSHFNTMFSLLSKYEQLEHKATCFKEALLLCDLYRNYSVLSVMQASLICARNKRHIFYTGQGNGFLLFIRAVFHPVLMFRYYK